MKEELISILLDAQRNYNHVSLHYIRELEKALHFDIFSKEDIERVSIGLLRASISYVIYDDNMSILYQNNMNESCINKANVTFQTNHTSIYPLMMYAISFEKQNMINEENYLPIFGSFPIFEQDKLKYVISIDCDDEINTFVKIINSTKNTNLNKFLGYIPKW